MLLYATLKVVIGFQYFLWKIYTDIEKIYRHENSQCDHDVDLIYYDDMKRQHYNQLM